MPFPVTAFSPLARGVVFVQEHDLVSRGVIDTLGTATPIIGLARNPQERREKIIDRVVVIGSLFLLAPLHAWLLMQGFARVNRIPQALMGLSYKTLQTPQHLKQALKTLPSKGTDAKAIKRFQRLISPRQLEALRQRIINAKVDMFTPDLILECLIMGGVGWITNFFSRWMTGRNRFSGELKATSEKNLNALYENEKGYQNSERFRMLATLAISFGVPIGIGMLLKRSMKPKTLSSPFLKWMRRQAPRFDYHKGYWMSTATLWTVCNVQLSGHLLSARNWRELRENFIRENLLTLICMQGLGVWMSVLKPLIYGPLKLPQENTVKAMIAKAPRHLKHKAARVGTNTYIAGILLNSATLCGALVLNNYLTHQKVQRDVKKLQTIQQTK